MDKRCDDIPDRSLFSQAGGAAFQSLTGEPPQTFWSKWFGGIIAPVAVLAGGVAVLLEAMRLIKLSGGEKVSMLTGVLAVLVAVGAATFLHFHYFWGNLRRESRIAYYAKSFGAGVAGVGLIVSAAIEVLSLMKG